MPQVLRFHEIMKAETTCTLDLEVVSEERCTPDKAKLYPANSLRNKALLNVKTEVGSFCSLLVAFPRNWFFDPSS